jgi:AcrR family transcriptional regulator
VSLAAGVQGPTIYRLFGSKQGLLDAVAVHSFNAILEKVAFPRTADPVEDLRTGWDLHVAFGLANAELYPLVHGGPRSSDSPPAVIAAVEALTRSMHRIASAGRLRIDEVRAAELVYATATGTTLTLLALPEDRRDLELSDLARDAVIAALTIEGGAQAAPGPAVAAVTLRAVLSDTSALTTHELALLRDWLDRIADADHGRTRDSR